METENTAEIGSFKDVVEQSREKIATSQSENEPKVRPQKRPVGRPRKNPRPDETPITSSAEVPSPPQNDFTPMLKPPIKYLGKIPAVKYQMPELEFSDSEATDCARAINDIANAFVPDIEKMDPKTAAVVNGCVVIGAVGFQKFLIFQEIQKSRRQDERKNQDAETIKQTAVPNNLTGADGGPLKTPGEYFNQTRV